MTPMNIRRYVNAILLPCAVILWCDPAFEVALPAPEPTAIVETDERVEPISRGGQRVAVDLGTFSVSAYCLVGTMRDGEWTHEGAVAVDPNVVALGSTLLIDGMDGIQTAHDTGGLVLGKHIDRWLPSCGEAIEWGVQRRRVWLVED